jgi:hypothetical protein
MQVGMHLQGGGRESNAENGITTMAGGDPTHIPIANTSLAWGKQVLPGQHMRLEYGICSEQTAVCYYRGGAEQRVYSLIIPCV